MKMIRHHTVCVYGKAVNQRRRGQVFDQPLRCIRVREDRAPAFATKRDEVRVLTRIPQSTEPNVFVRMPRLHIRHIVMLSARKEKAPAQKPAPTKTEPLARNARIRPGGSARDEPSNCRPKKKRPIFRSGVFLHNERTHPGSLCFLPQNRHVPSFHEAR